MGRFTRRCQNPISIVYHMDTQLTELTPILLYAYGSYGHTIDPSFSSNRLSLLDRGFALHRHIRGGEYLGGIGMIREVIKEEKYIFRFYRLFEILNPKKFTSQSILCQWGICGVC